MNHYRAIVFILSLFLVKVAYPEQKPMRTFVTVQHYTLENNGEGAGTISNVKLEFTFPNKKKLDLPGTNQYWPISNGQTQEINQTYEIPAQWIEKDGYKFKMQMVRKGAEFLPCEVEVNNLSEFNREYVCRVDVNWQEQHHIAPEKIAREAIQIRVFTDKNSKPSEIPTNALALKMP